MKTKLLLSALILTAITTCYSAEQHDEERLVDQIVTINGKEAPLSKHLADAAIKAHRIGRVPEIMNEGKFTLNGFTGLLIDHIRKAAVNPNHLGKVDAIQILDNPQKVNRRPVRFQNGCVKGLSINNLREIEQGNYVWVPDYTRKNLGGEEGYQNINGIIVGKSDQKYADILITRAVKTDMMKKPE